MSTHVNVRAEQPFDSAAVRVINERAFGSPLEADLVDRLRGIPGAVSLVASTNEEIVGHILFTPVTVEPASDWRVAGLGPMSVHPEHQRTGIGSQLVRAGLEACRAVGYAAVVVVGHATYYPRFGFEAAHLWGLQLLDFDVPPDVFMALALEMDARARPAGAIRYRREFSETG
jgi:putative acetyltransferase